MNKLRILNPDEIKVDERSMNDLINFVGNISRELNYFDENNVASGSFNVMFSGDESFLISEIASFEHNKYFDKKNILIKKYDESTNYDEKIKISLELLNLSISFFRKIDEWFERAFKQNINLNNTQLQIELESVIKNQASKIFQNLKLITKIYNENGFLSENKTIENYFKSDIWNYSKTSHFKINTFNDFNNDILFKNLVLINNSVFKILKTLVIRSRKQLSNILKRPDHNPHIGLLLTFITLFKHLQNDINKISKKHLDFYYSKILGSKLKKAKPNYAYSVITIDDNLNNVEINKSELIVAGQYDDGSEIKYKLENSLLLNNAKVSYLMTIFSSKSEIFQYNSRYRLISSIFSKVLAKNYSEVDSFNNNNDVFNALGIDQNFLNDNNPKMDNADIGFIIGSRSLSLGKSNREIFISFEFDAKSITHLSDLIIDLSTKSNLNEDETFSRIFSDSFELFYTIKNKWEKINYFEILNPDDWSQKTLTVKININKSMPAFSNFDNEFHKENLKINSPAIKFVVRQDSFYNSYGFLNKMKLNKLKIEANVSELAQFRVFRDGDEIPLNSDFELFGSTPKCNSNFYIGCEEIFNKKIFDIKLRWKYSNLDTIDNNLKDYYKNYNININNRSFNLGVSFLSDFNYTSIKEYEKFEMFDEVEGLLSENKEFIIRSISNSKINPIYSLKDEYIEDFSNNYETGFIKVSLLEPSIGFGFNLYGKLSSQLLLDSVNPKKKDNNNSFEINEPFAPKINNFFIDYTTGTTLYFDESLRLSNDFEEDNSFFHISPFGINRTFSKNNIDESLFYDFKNEGELIVGLESDSKIKNLDILFEILKNENDNYQFSRDIQWHYSTANGWKEIPKQNILSDETDGLLSSGIVSIIMPDNFSNANYILDKNHYHLRVVSKNKADQFGLVKSIYTNSAKVIEVIPENEKLRLNKLNKGSLVSFDNNIKGINSIYQPLDSPKISLFESDMSFYHRISQILKHKNRPATSSDYESFIIQNFDFLSYARVINNSNNKVSILCLKKIDSIQNIDEIKLSASEKIKIKDYLKAYSPTHFSFEIVNPIFEDVWVKCSVLFKDIYVGRGLEKLNSDILNYVCPWRNSGNILNIPEKINNIDLLSFIKSRNYISYISGFSVIHFSTDLRNKIRLYDSALQENNKDFIETGSKQSIFVPRNNHKIEILSDTEYIKPLPVSFEDLEIDKSFITAENNFIKKKDPKIMDSEEFKNLQFIIK